MNNSSRILVEENKLRPVNEIVGVNKENLKNLTQREILYYIRNHYKKLDSNI